MIERYNPREGDNYQESWEVRNELFRIVMKEIYGGRLNDEQVEELRRVKFGEEKISPKVAIKQVGLMAKTIFLGLTPQRVLGRAESILKSLDEDERRIAELAIGLKAGHKQIAPTREAISEQAGISVQRVNELVISATSKLRPPREK